MDEIHPYLQRQPATVDRPVMRRRNFKVPLIEMIRPDGPWPYPFSIEQAFETMRSFVATATDAYDTQQRWGTNTVAGLLTGGGGLGTRYMAPIKSLEDLRKRFHLAILARAGSEGQERWRADHGISPAGTVSVSARINRPYEPVPEIGFDNGAHVKKTFDELTAGDFGVRMAVCLNSVHTDQANWMRGVTVSIYPGKFCFVLEYGTDTSEPGYSSWKEVIARTRDGETFLDTLARARDVRNCLVHGIANGCDLGDLDRSYMPDFVLDQVEELHLANEATPAMR